MSAGNLVYLAAKRLVWLVSGLLLGLLLAEFFCRCLMPAPEWVEMRAGPETMELTGLADGLHLRSIAGLRLRPDRQATVHNQHLSGEDILIRTNSLGFRNPELPPRQDRRYLFLGDSITFAGEVVEEASFVRRAEILARQRGERIETVNGAVGATGVQDYLNILKESVSKAVPDAVVICLYLNDFEPSLAYPLLQPPRMLRWSWLAHHALSAYAVLRGFIFAPEAHFQGRIEAAAMIKDVNLHFEEREQLQPDALEFKQQVLSKLDDWGGSWSRSGQDRIVSVLNQFAAELQERKIDGLLLLLPVRNQVEAAGIYDFPQRTLSSAAKRFGWTVIDLLPRFRAESQRGQTDLFYDHCHLTPAGHAIVAEEVSTYLSGAAAR
jgi:lysophospholipase L1-like esterase